MAHYRKKKAIEYIKGVGEALEHIHSKNMTHFDVKPSNIVIRKSDDKPILIDFGLSKQYNKEGEATSTLLHGVSNGYSPIELYNADENLTFSPQTDVYSLAATLYYLLEGQTPPVSLELVTKKLDFANPIKEYIKEAIIKGMALNKEKRYTKINFFTKDLSHGTNNNTKIQTETTVLSDYVSSGKRINNLFGLDSLDNSSHWFKLDDRGWQLFYKSPKRILSYTNHFFSEMIGKAKKGDPSASTILKKTSWGVEFQPNIEVIVKFLKTKKS